MPVNINVRIEDIGVRAVILDMQRRTGDLRPAMKIVGETVLASILRNFESGGRPVPWKPSKRSAKTGGKTLIRTGELMRSINYRAGSNRVVISANKKYAAIHQFGGKTPAQIISARVKKALYWPGAKHPVKSVRHPGSLIPARPFLMVQDEDWTEIKNALNNYLMRRL